MFSPVVLSHWIPESVRPGPDGRVAVAVDAALPANRPVSLLHLDAGGGVLALTPDRAEELGLADGDRIERSELSARIAGAGITLTDPDRLFYLEAADRGALLDETPDVRTRQLGGADADAFQEFTAGLPADELDEAFVELDHWLVFGGVVDGRLVCAASMYPWRGSRLADLGVITLPGFRGRGVGRATVRAMSAEALRRGHEPQYRCQLDNHASAALASAAGFTAFGTWELVVAEDDD